MSNNTLIIYRGENSTEQVNAITKEYKTGVSTYGSCSTHIDMEGFTNIFNFYKSNPISSYIFIGCAPTEESLNFILNRCIKVELPEDNCWSHMEKLRAQRIKEIKVSLINDKSFTFSNINSLAHSKGCITPLKGEELEYQCLVNYSLANFEVKKESLEKEYRHKYIAWTLDNIVNGALISSICTESGFKLGFVLFTPVNHNLLSERLFQLQLNNKGHPDFIVVFDALRSGEPLYTVVVDKSGEVSKLLRSITLTVENFPNYVNVMVSPKETRKNFPNYDPKYIKENESVHELISGNPFKVTLTGQLKDHFGETATFRLSSGNVVKSNSVNFYIKLGKVIFPDYLYINMTVSDFASQMEETD